jgi:hypothetical protein
MHNHHWGLGMACSAAIKDLADGYAQGDERASLDHLRILAGKYLEARSISILDAAAIGLAFDVVFSADKVDISQLTPAMVAAWEKAYPNVPIESLANRSTEEIAGIISGWKGKLFEVEVERRLNDGEWVGDLHLEPGQTAKIADSANQPGWDIQIFDGDHHVTDEIQLKATESVGYIHEALARYPDTPILVTHEVAAKISGVDVLDSGISNNHLTGEVADHIADATSDSLGDAVIGTMPVSIILATEAYGVLTGRKSVDDAFSAGGDRLAKGAISGAVGAAVSVVGTPILGAFAAFITRVWLGGEDKKSSAPKFFVPPSFENMHGRVKRLCDQTRDMSANYSCERTITTNAPTPNISDQQELLDLVDESSRLEIDRGTMPLSSYINDKLGKYMEAMPEVVLRRHVADLEMIRDRDWVGQAFPRSGFIQQFVREVFDSECKAMRRELATRIELGHLLLKRYVGRLTASDEEALMLFGMTPDQKREHQKKKIRDRIRAEERQKYPYRFNPDGSRKST